MTDFAKPAAILLSTDLTARSDRAHARAVQLARQWRARLVVAIALQTDANFSLPNAFQDPNAAEDAPTTESPTSWIGQMAAQALADAGVEVDIRIAVGAPGPVVAGIAHDASCGLIVTGTSRSDVAMRMDPGSTLRWLTRHAKLPVLAVHDRVRGPYRQLAVASDFSPPSAHALQLAAQWFDDATERNLLHGYDTPLATLALNDAPRREALAALQLEVENDAGAFLAQSLGEAASRWSTRVRPGNPIRLLREHARSAGTDLTVIATHGRGALLSRLIGSVAERLLETTGTDLLVVPPAR